MRVKLFRLWVWTVTALAVTAWAVPAFAAGQEAARVIAATPGVFVERDGQRTPLAVKDAVFQRDVIVTDATGKAQILFRDDTTVAVAPDSTIHVSQFSFGGDGKAAFGMRLSRGMSRVVTGRVVEQNREGFHITTPHATVGIRGTILTPRVTAEATTIIVSQVGAGHTVSVTNTRTGQMSEVGRGGLTVVAASSGNVTRPSTPAEKVQAQSAARQTAVAAAPAAPAASETPASGAGNGKDAATASNASGATNFSDASGAPSAPSGVEPGSSLNEGASPLPEVSVSLPDVGADVARVAGVGGNAAVPPLRTETLEEIARKVESAATDGNGSPEQPDRPDQGGIGPSGTDGTGHPEHGGSSNPELDDGPEPGDEPNMPDLPDNPDINGGGSTGNPSNLTASYVGTLQASGVEGMWGGSFHFDVNLGNGDMNNAGLALNSINGHGGGASIIELDGGTGQARADRFTISGFTGTGNAPCGQILQDIQGSMGGSLVLGNSPASDTQVDQLHIWDRNHPDLVTSGHGTGFLQPVDNAGGAGH